MPGHQPVEVRIDLVTPLVVGADPLCLDSLLAERVALLRFGAAARDRSRPLEELDLPLSRTGEVWHASIGFPVSGVLGRDFQVKRWAVDPPPGVKQSLGWSKGYYIPVWCLATPALMFWARGETAAIRQLLATVQALGKNRNKGFGQVRRITVRPVHQDWSLWREGMPQRPIPVHQVERPWAYYTAVTGFRPPTWAPQNQGLCVMPLPDIWLCAYAEPGRRPDPDEEAWHALETEGLTDDE